MNKVRASAPQLEGLVPYDPKYLPAEAYLSANENPRDVDAEVRAAIARRIAQVPLNRYPILWPTACAISSPRPTGSTAPMSFWATAATSFCSMWPSLGAARGAAS